MRRQRELAPCRFMAVPRWSPGRMKEEEGGNLLSGEMNSFWGCAVSPGEIWRQGAVTEPFVDSQSLWLVRRWALSVLRWGARAASTEQKQPQSGAKLALYGEPSKFAKFARRVSVRGPWKFVCHPYVPKAGQLTQGPKWMSSEDG